MTQMGPMTPMTGDALNRLYKTVTPKAFKTIFVVQGNLDNEKLRQLPENIEGCILVTGNVNLTECNVHCELIVLGDCLMNHTAVEGSVTVYGKFQTTKGLMVYGTLCTRPDAEITGRVLVAGRTYC